jgi:hypothetical protein
MKKLVILISILTLIFISGCENAKTETSAVGTDYTVMLENTFTVSGDENIITSVVEYDNTSFQDSDGYPLSKVFDSMDYYVLATVHSVTFYDEADNIFPSTLFNIKIDKVYKGDLKVGDIVTGGQQGGYMRLSKEIEKTSKGKFEHMSDEEIANTLILKTVFGDPIVEVGEQYFLGLRQFGKEKYDQSKMFPAEAYVTDILSKHFKNDDGEWVRQEPTRYKGIYLPRDEKGNVVEVTRENDDKFTFEELDKKLEELKKAVKE